MEECTFWSYGTFSRILSHNYIEIYVEKKDNKSHLVSIALRTKVILNETKELASKGLIQSSTVFLCENIQL